MEDMCLVERDGASFYAPMGQAEAWSEQGYAVYAVRVVPLNEKAVAAEHLEAASCESEVAAAPEMEAIG